jgi:hypothetical protein
MRQNKRPRQEKKGSVMVVFLLRAAFWLSIIVLVMPSNSSTSAGSQAGASDAVSAATAAVSDVRQFCDRQREACTLGSQAAVAFGQKAQASAKMLYDLFTEKGGPSTTGSITAAGGKMDASAGSQNTLAPTDVAPAWRSPETRSERSKRPS